MPDTLDYTTTVAMLRSAADIIKENRDYLSKLDSATGDGDHGTAVAKVANAIVATIEADESNDLKKLLKAIGWAAMSTDADFTSPLYGSLFMGMSAATPEDGAIDCNAVAAIFASGVEKLRKNTKAQVGDKTMIDALVPAIAAIQSAADADKSIKEAIQAGAEAAVKGAESTKELQAAFGRAKNLGERSVGHLDPGATSMSLFFSGLEKGL